MTTEFLAPQEVLKLLASSNVTLPELPNGETWEVNANEESWGEEGAEETISPLFLGLRHSDNSYEELFLGEFGTFNANNVLFVANLLLDSSTNKDNS